MDTTGLARELSLTLLLVFLAFRLTERRRVAICLCAGVQGITVAVYVAMQIMGQLTLYLVLALSAISLAGLVAALVCGVLEWKRNWFFHCFCPLTAAGAITWAALGYWRFDGHSSGMLLWPLAGIMTAAALVTALAEAVRRKTARRTEARLLAQRNELAQDSYKALRRQNEQVMMSNYGKAAREICSDIPERVHPHQLRHTRAIHLYRGGMPLSILSEFLGHASEETTRIYAYADTEMKRKAIEKAAPRNIPGDETPIWDTSDDEVLRKLAGLY